jgi:hypothetical protein
MPRALIHTTSAGTTVLVPAQAGKAVRVGRLYVNGSGPGTVDFQDTTGATLVGGALPVSNTTPAVYIDGLMPELQHQVPLFLTPVGTGLQLVTTGAININGFVDYFLSPP